jgi:5-methylcytosine-specific restriction endonuclease McrA
MLFDTKNKYFYSMSDTLVLNHDGAPLSMLPPSVIDWQLAVKLLYLNKVMVIKEYEDWAVRSQHLELKVPSIVMTRRYVRPRQKVLFNRRMVYLRDNFTCQYCGEQFQAKDLTLDHVKPKSKGGNSTWSNLVTCCGTCNWLKGAKVIEPLTVPKEPNYWQMVKAAKMVIPYSMRDPAWGEYLGYSDVPKEATG